MKVAPILRAFATRPDTQSRSIECRAQADPCPLMFNRLHARVHRPEAGWDPVPAVKAQQYADDEWAHGNWELIDELEAAVGGLAGKTVLDLGAGPGHFAAAMAERGATVTWYDISATYRRLAEARVRTLGLAERIRFTIGYLDEAPQRLNERFALVFNRVCWYYAFGDRSFATVVWSLVEPGGYGYVDTTNSSYGRAELSRSARLRTWLNEKMAIKIGHPMPPRGRLAREFLRLPIERLSVDYRSATNDRILFRRSPSSA